MWPHSLGLTGEPGGSRVKRCHLHPIKEEYKGGAEGSQPWNSAAPSPVIVSRKFKQNLSSLVRHDAYYKDAAFSSDLSLFPYDLILKGCWCLIASFQTFFILLPNNPENSLQRSTFSRDFTANIRKILIKSFLCFITKLLESTWKWINPKSTLKAWKTSNTSKVNNFKSETLGKLHVQL